MLLKNTNLETYINVSETVTPQWEWVEKGFTDFSETINNTETEKYYVGYQTAFYTNEGTTRTYNFDLDLYSDSTLGMKLNDMANISGRQELQVLRVEKYRPGTVTGTYKAFKYNCLVSFSEKNAGAGNVVINIKGTMLVNGDGITGTFNPTTKTFTPDTN